ncbi:MAG: metallophosphoesterase family protein [Alphaproteobacteria bacterium]|jgi:3',5'-cyclic AMP phosphodiesterase CpdA|tara:strand:+ start:45198 stop:46121 length:924 start_codon:yes stop_codon:yes gene_type:complete
MLKYTISHISDLHLPIIKTPKYKELFNKRIIGFINWHLNRKNNHNDNIIKDLINDLKKQGSDHLIVSGDLINLSLEDEYINASKILKKISIPENISVVPGNHDSYIKIDFDKSIFHWKDHIGTDTVLLNYFKSKKNPFPYLKIRNDIALIGLSSAIPTMPFMCYGKIGKDQLKNLEDILIYLSKKNYFKILILHHPIHKIGPFNYKGLLDNNELIKLLDDYNIELLLHGHLHRDSITYLKTKNSIIPCFGTPSSSKINKKEKQTSYNKYEIYKINDKWNFNAYRRVYRSDTNKFTQEKINLNEIKIK